MKRQPFCCLPHCGATGTIEMHHRVRRSQGGSDDDSNLVPICKECHTKHHDGRYILDFRELDGVLQVEHKGYVNWRPVVVYNEHDQTVPFDEAPEDEGERVHDLTAYLQELAETRNTMDYCIGSILEELAPLLSSDELRYLTEETFGLSPKTVPSFISRRKKIARFDEQYAYLGLSKLLLLSDAIEKSELPLEALLVDLKVLSTNDFAIQHLGRKEKTIKKHACPDCGAVHVCKCKEE